MNTIQLSFSEVIELKSALTNQINKYQGVLIYALNWDAYELRDELNDRIGVCNKLILELDGGL